MLMNNYKLWCFNYNYELLTIIIRIYNFMVSAQPYSDAKARQSNMI